MVRVQGRVVHAGRVGKRDRKTEQLRASMAVISGFSGWERDPCALFFIHSMEYAILRGGLAVHTGEWVFFSHSNGSDRHSFASVQMSMSMST